MFASPQYSFFIPLLKRLIVYRNNKTGVRSDGQASSLVHIIMHMMYKNAGNYVYIHVRITHEN